MLPSETMIWQPEFTDKTLSRKPGAVQLLDKIITIQSVSPGCIAFVVARSMTGSGVRNRFNKANRYYKTRGTIYFVFR
ncbi:hypothetical protein F6P96_05970 [Escherichia coli]|nr:hypothetical protein F6P96_05970 [Escherichia coli]